MDNINVNLDLEFTILLPGGGVFRFAGPFPVSREQWQHIQAVMDAMAPGLIASQSSAPCGVEHSPTAIPAPRAPVR